RRFVVLQEGVGAEVPYHLAGRILDNRVGKRGDKTTTRIFIVVAVREWQLRERCGVRSLHRGLSRFRVGPRITRTFGSLVHQWTARIRSAAFSPIITDGALVLPPTSVGMIEASTTRSASTPRTRNCGSTTASPSTPMRQVPTG